MAGKNTKDVALVLSSGGPRGFAYIGAIEELVSRGYNITSVAGSSIGSLVGGVFAAGELDSFKDWLFGLDNVKLMKLLDFSISKRYLMKGEKVINAIQSVVPNVMIEDLPIPYVAVTTDLYTGEAHEFHEGKLFDAIRASISIPFMFKPVSHIYRTFVDGGLVSTFPLGRVARNGHDILVGFDVNTTDEEEITSFLKDSYSNREKENERWHNALTALNDVRKNKSLSLLDKVKAISDESETFLKNEIKSKTSKTASTAPKETEADVNYFSILSRSFSIANHTIAKLETQMYKPDVLATMSMDSYGAIPDYAKAEEISEKGRKIMAAALDKYEAGLG